MSDSMFTFLVFLAISIFVTYFLKKEEKTGKRQSDKDLVFGFIVNIFIFLQLEFKLYQEGASILAFILIMFLAWGLLTLYTQSKRGSHLLKNKNLVKFELIFTSILVIATQVMFFISTIDLDLIYLYSKNDFRNILILTTLFIAYNTYLFTKRTVNFLFVEKDLLRKIFIISQIIFIMIFIVGNFYNIKNINRFDFYVESEDYQEISGEELWNH